MMVRRPGRRVTFGSVGLGDAAWVAPWLSAGYNDADMGGQILAFMEAQPNQPAGNDPVSVAQRTGRWVPWTGSPGGLPSVAATPQYPYLRFGLPTDSVQNGPSGLLNLSQVPPSNFISPGDDAMLWAIQHWVGVNAPANPAGGGAAPFSQAVGSSGLTAAQAATIAALSQPGAASSPGYAVSPGSPGQASGQQPASSGAAVEAGSSSIPWWVWAVGAAVALWFVVEGS